MKKRAGRVRILAAMLLISGARVGLADESVKAQGTAESGFSFAVYGDSRSMMYLPYRADQEADAKKLMVDLFSLVMPEKLSEDLVNKNVKLIYDPKTKELVQVVMPFMSRNEVTTLTVDKGWVTRTPVALVEYRYDCPFTFTGTIDKLTFDLGPSQMTADERKQLPALKDAVARARD